MPKTYSAAAHEWPFPVSVETLEKGPKTFTFQADAQERADLARRFAIVSIESAEASVTAQDVGGGMVHAIGTVRADITQACAVSLAPIKARIEEEFEGWFGDKGKAVSFARAKTEREARKGHVDAEVLEESVDPEPIIGGKVDLGELAAQYLSLAIDPYAHAPGVAYEFGPEQGARQTDGANLRKSPFEALKDWKEKR
jgi:hypothetical protein